mmetsp:Transcript_41353/g.94825  ORF Transcript_41353/g.94825 Transcript_41353/m.94825 type:complete len:296 (+) Transcript_41353:3-890(+)
MSQGVYISSYIGGNIDQAEARELFDAMAHTFDGSCALPRSKIHLGQCVELPSSAATLWRVPSRNPADANCAVEVYWQLGESTLRLSAMLSLLDHLMFEPLFDSLRTKQQIGYSVRCSSRNTMQVLGFCIGVVSATHSPTSIEDSVSKFLVEFVDFVKNMPAAEYKKNIDSAVENKLQDDHNMLEEAERFFSEIGSFQYVFDRAEKEAAEMAVVEQAELVTWVHSSFLSESKRVLSVHVYVPSNDLDEVEALDRFNRIELPSQFKEGLANFQHAIKELPAESVPRNNPGKAAKKKK